MLYLVTIAGAIQLTRWVLTLLDANRKAPCAYADQSTTQRSLNTNRHRAAGTVIVPASRR